MKEKKCLEYHMWLKTGKNYVENDLFSLAM
jgi:hypothetical protein